MLQVLSSMADASIIEGMTVERGLYCSVFPVLIYAIFGPSRHISIGNIGFWGRGAEVEMEGYGRVRLILEWLNLEHETL